MAIDDLFMGLRPEWIVYRDDALVAINKPAGLSTASSDGADDLLSRLKRWLATETGSTKPPYVGVHEHLERDTSGLVLFTLDKRANKGLAQQLERHTVTRGYQVITALDQSARLITSRLRGAPLRAQLAQARTPVIGDALHKGPSAHRVMCHAASLQLRHPLTEDALSLSCTAPRSLVHPGDQVKHLQADPSYRAALLIEAAAKRAHLRANPSDRATNAYRWVNGESDGLPGIAIDVYDRWLVLHVFDTTWVVDADALARDVHSLAGTAGIYIKQHPKQKNQLAADAIATLAHELPAIGQQAPDPLRIVENGVPLFVRLGDGLRTGLFLDQRDNRARIRELSPDKHVLNLFAYTCGFSVAALAGGAASVTSVDASSLVMSRVEPSLQELNAHNRHQTIVGDCFEVLRALAESERRFDVVIIDPPSYASTSAGRFRLRRDYPSLVRAAIAVCAPGATLLLCTNHHGTTDRDLHGFVVQGIQSSGGGAIQVRTSMAPIDFSPLPGGQAELKSVWVTLDSVLRPNRGRV